MKNRSATSREGTRCTTLVLQGGGALGAYQGGAFAALAATGQQPDWVAGISIGAINAALIAGNPPAQRAARLREFWERITHSTPPRQWLESWPERWPELWPERWPGHPASSRSWASDMAAAWVVAFGVSDFFSPRPGAAIWPWRMDQPSLYDTQPLRRTMLELIDFDLLNDGPMRLSVGAVDVETGNFAYFDNRLQTIAPEHIMASGALPPGFPAVTVDGRSYWDGGLVSNTPLSYVVDNLDVAEATIFQVDLFSARGALPETLREVAEREKDIRFSSRTRAVTDMLRERHRMHARIRTLAAMLPNERQSDPQVQQILAELNDTAIRVVHLIHRDKGNETQTKDYEFSRATMLEHWQAGLRDMRHSLRMLARTPRAMNADTFRTFDFDARTNEEDIR